MPTNTKIIPKTSKELVAWFKCDLNRKELRGYMKRADRLPLLSLAGHLSLILATGTLTYLSRGEQWFLAILFTFGARFFGGPLVWVMLFTEHPGLDENVHDHRRNSRTIYTNQIMRFLCWNINCHIEHHMYPMVPFHQLPALHVRITQELPPSDPSDTLALIRTLSAVFRQMRDPEYFDKPILPQQQ